MCISYAEKFYVLKIRLNLLNLITSFEIWKEPGNLEFLFLNTWIFLDGAGCGWSFEYIITYVVVELSKVLPTLIWSQTVTID